MILPINAGSCLRCVVCVNSSRELGQTCSDCPPRIKTKLLSAKVVKGVVACNLANELHKQKNLEKAK